MNLTCAAKRAHLFQEPVVGSLKCTESAYRCQVLAMHCKDFNKAGEIQFKAFTSS
jgi:hypothetical protein